MSNAKESSGGLFDSLTSWWGSSATQSESAKNGTPPPSEASPVPEPEKSVPIVKERYAIHPLAIIILVNTRHQMQTNATNPHCFAQSSFSRLLQPFAEIRGRTIGTQNQHAPTTRFVYLWFVSRAWCCQKDY